MSAQPPSRRRLAVMALTRFVGGLVIIISLILLPAGTTSYWQAWLFIAVLFGAVAFGFTILIVEDPALLERRMRMKEQRPRERLVVRLGAIAYLAVFIVPGLDRRLGWSSVPMWAVLAADGVIVLGYVLFISVMRANSWASRVVEVEAGQRVVTTGPYAVVRHPMYVAALLIFVATPVALGSWWALLASLLVTATFVVRIFDEERLLVSELAGYSEYTLKTRYRLLPGIW